MAIYRNIQMSFWTDTKIVDEFTPEDRYFYLYLLTNPHTNLCGCYEISIKQMSNDTGYKEDVITTLLRRMQQNHKVIIYENDTKELLLLNWNKFNWTSSEKFRKPLLDEIEKVKNPEFKGFLLNLYNGEDTVSIPYPYGSDTTVSVSVTDTVTDTVSVTEKKKPQKLSFGENNLVKLTQKEYDRLLNDFGEDITKNAIQYLDGYIADKGYKSKSNYQAIRRWVIDAVTKRNQKKSSGTADDWFREKGFEI